MYMTDERPRMGHNRQTGRADGGVLRQDRILAVEDEAPSLEGARERSPCAKLTLGIDPRRTDSGVGGRLQLGGTIYGREGTPRPKEGLR